MTTEPAAVARSTGPLELLVFVVGMATLGAEIATARLMAPFFGASTIVWANTIAVVLVALSGGYWLGGRIADRHPHLRGLCVLVMVAALLLGLLPIVADPFLSLSVEAFDSFSVGAFAGSLFGVLGLVAIPVLMLGAVSPWAIRLKLRDLEGSGEVAGRMYGISTLGSLVGTFLSALLLIPLVGTQRTFGILALLLALVAVVVVGVRWIPVPLLLVALLFLPTGAIKLSDDARVIHERETEYQYARVVQDDDGERRLELNEGQAVHSVYRADSVLTEGVWDGYLTAPFSVRRQAPERLAILGFGAGTTARAYAKYFPETRIDGVEIDGELSSRSRANGSARRRRRSQRRPPRDVQCARGHPDGHSARGPPARRTRSDRGQEHAARRGGHRAAGRQPPLRGVTAAAGPAAPRPRRRRAAGSGPAGRRCLHGRPRARRVADRRVDRQLCGPRKVMARGPALAISGSAAETA